MSDPVWMQPPNLRLYHKPVVKSKHDQPHSTWPWNPAVLGEIPQELDGLLQQRQGTGCRLVRYLFANSQWRFDRATKRLDDVKDMVLLADSPQPQDNASSAFFLASSLQDEAIRSLGHWLCIPPLFFALPRVHLRVITGTKGRDYLAFSLQYMRKYPVGYKSFDNLPRCRFRTQSDYQPHEWHATQARLIFFANDAASNHTRPTSIPSRSSSSDQGNKFDHTSTYWKGLYMFDDDDDPVATKLTDWLVALDREDPNAAELCQGLGQVIQDVLYIISNIRTQLFDEAMEHLQILGDKCLEEDLDPVKQLEYTRELYKLFPLWSQIRRQLNGTKNLVAQVSRHKISSFEPGVRDDRYYLKRLSVVEDQLTRCEDAVDKTKNLINLIMSIASLQESRAAVKESRAANELARGISRITGLTFAYLPLTLASSVLGMNVHQITGEAGQVQLWVYIALAVGIMVATFGGPVVWTVAKKWIVRGAARMAARRTIRRADAAKGV